MKKFIDEPMMFFTGFRSYQKEASKVDYNPDLVDYRLDIWCVSRRITVFYGKCDKDTSHFVLIAFTTYLLDNNLLKDRNELELTKV